MVEFKNPETNDKSEDVESGLNSNSSDQEISNGKLKRKSESEGNGSHKKKKKSKSDRGKINGVSHGKRRHSVSKPARDPRDEVYPPTPLLEVAGTRSPSPVIDFDGLSRPSKCQFFLLLSDWGLNIDIK